MPIVVQALRRDGAVVTEFLLLDAGLECLTGRGEGMVRIRERLGERLEVEEVTPKRLWGDRFLPSQRVLRFFPFFFVGKPPNWISARVRSICLTTTRGRNPCACPPGRERSSSEKPPAVRA